MLADPAWRRIRAWARTVTVRFPFDRGRVFIRIVSGETDTDPTNGAIPDGSITPPDSFVQPLIRARRNIGASNDERRAHKREEILGKPANRESPNQSGWRVGVSCRGMRCIGNVGETYK
jgi:hypothetical protein